MGFLFSLCYFLIPGLACLIVYYFLPYSSQPKKTSSPPPGGRGWPVIGESLEYFTDLKKGAPEHFVQKRFKKYSSKVFKTSLMGEQIAMLSGAEGNKLLFSGEGKTVKFWVPEFIHKIFVFSSQEDFHKTGTTMRKVVKQDFKADHINRYVPLLDSIMKKQLKTYWNVKQVKVSDVVDKYTSTYSCLLFLSIEDVCQVEKLGKQMKDVIVGTVSMAIDLPGTAFRKSIRVSNIVRKQIEEMIKQRNRAADEKNDLLSHLLEVNNENSKMAEMSVATLTMGLMHASTSPIESTLCSMMMYLAELPDVYSKVHQEQMQIRRSKDPKSGLNWDDIGKMRYTWNVAKEVLRLRPPTVGTFREAITDINYDGYTIPKGWKLHWMAYATHKNSEYFENPEEFDPSRFERSAPPSYAFVPFGGGPNMCPGNEFSRLVILVFIHNVVTTFRWEKTILNEKIVTDPVPRPAQGLPVLLHPHKDSAC